MAPEASLLKKLMVMEPGWTGMDKVELVVVKG